MVLKLLYLLTIMEITYELLKNTFILDEPNIFGFGSNDYVYNKLHDNIILTNPRKYPLSNMYIIIDPFRTPNMILNFTVTTKKYFSTPKKINSLKSYSDFIQKELAEILKTIRPIQLTDPNIFKNYLLDKYGFMCNFENGLLVDRSALNKVTELLGIHITIFENTWNQSPQCTYCSTTSCLQNNKNHLIHISKYINDDVLLSNSVDLCGVYMIINDDKQNVENANFTYDSGGISSIENCVTLKNECTNINKKYFDMLQSQFILLLKKIKSIPTNGGNMYYNKYLKYKNKYLKLKRLFN